MVGDGSPANDAWDMARGGFRIDWDANQNNQMTLQGDIYGGDHDQMFTLFDSSPPHAEFTAPYSTKVSGGNLIGRWTHQIADDSDVRMQVYYDQNRRDYILLEEDCDTFDVDLQHRFPLGERQDIVWGGGYRVSSDEIGNSFDMVVTPDHRTIDLFSGFVQDEIVLVEDTLSLTLGTKLEHNDFTGVELLAQWPDRVDASPPAYALGLCGASRANAFPRRSGWPPVDRGEVCASRGFDSGIASAFRVSRCQS